VELARGNDDRNVYRILVGKPERKRPLGRPKRRWVDNNRMNLVEMGWGGVDWIGLAQDRHRWRALVNAIMNLRVPYYVAWFLSACTADGLSSSIPLHIVS
jgi:hypothetical protein